MTENYLDTVFTTEHFSLSELQLTQFQNYYELLTERNKVMNLTAITSWEEVCVKHFLDSVMLWKYIDAAVRIPEGDNKKPERSEEGFNEEIRYSVIDIGTGAGFPGLPLKILRPEIRLTLLDALQKRIDFLDEVIRATGLREAETVHGRAEDVVKKHRESYDLAVSRAVAYLPVLAEYCLPFVKTGGLFAAYKSGDVEEECKASENALAVLGGELEKTEKFVLPDGSKRSLLLIRKVSATPEKYPRRSKKIDKEPL